MKIKRRYNWKHDTPDARDKIFRPRFVTLTKPLPERVDLRPGCPPIVDQGQIGSCTGNALAGLLGYLENQELENGGGPQEFNKKKFSAFSRLFIYWNERSLEGDPMDDGGAQIRDGIQTLATLGACQEPTWPYSPEMMFIDPSAAAYQEALSHRISLYQRLDTTDINALKQCLAEVGPFVFGFNVYESFESEEVARTGMMPIPSPAEPLRGGHAVLCVGYDDESKRFVVRNSWGTEWGDKGYFYMPYAFLTNGSMADDAWSVTK